MSKPSDNRSSPNLKEDFLKKWPVLGISSQEGRSSFEFLEDRAFPETAYWWVDVGLSIYMHEVSIQQYPDAVGTQDEEEPVKYRVGFNRVLTPIEVSELERDMNALLVARDAEWAAANKSIL